MQHIVRHYITLMNGSNLENPWAVRDHSCPKIGIGKFQKWTDPLMLAVVKKSEQDMLNYLSTEVGFLTGVGFFDGEPLTFDAYQLGFLANQKKYRWVKKARQVGFSFLFAAEAIARCHLREGHTSVWTGSRMLVWGGLGQIFYGSGGAYDPATDSWTSISTVNEPAARIPGPVAWTGDRMVVWGGLAAAGEVLGSGGRYDPAADTWTPTAVGPAPEARTAHTAVWTGSVGIVWGGSAERGFTV